MSDINVISTPENVIAAYQEGAAVFEVTCSSDIIRIEVEIYTSNQTWIRDFFGDELTNQPISINVQKYIEEFSFSNLDIYRDVFCLTSCFITRGYRVEIKAYINETEYLSYSFDGTALCSLDFLGEEMKLKYDILTDNSDVVITTSTGENILIIRKL